MTIAVFIPGPLRGETEGRSRIDVGDGDPATLGAVLDSVARRYPRLERRIRDERGRLRRFVNVYVGADECRTLAEMDSPVPDGTEVRILPSVAGG